jgi:DNA-binding response OmpR family regulator
MDLSNKPDSTRPGGRPGEWSAGGEVAGYAQSSRKRVLVIEEDEATGELLQTILEGEAGCETLWLKSTADAFRVECPGGTPEAYTPDLLVVDVSIKEADNLRLLEDLRARGIRLPPVLVLTAWPAAQGEEAARRLDAVALVVKPFDIDALVLEAKKALRSQAGDQPGA